MEAATLSSPQRNYNAVPVQKSLSLPSYARAGGEGIDHRIIFAALEQREKVRRKSRIFTREKTARQNIFCLPISSGAKCRETSFSSDTSCSSLEYQKPKKDASKLKKDEAKLSKIEKSTVNELSTVKTSQLETKTSQLETKTTHPENKTNHSPKDVSSRNGDMDQDLQRNPIRTADYYRKGHRSPSDTFRSNVHSSDSMDRSSRSSNDSLSRKERLVAIKAKVEAAREKYGDTSSEEENRSTITRYNSDGVIHRTVKEVKSRSYRLEKRLRRRSQDEYAMRKIYRKNNLSLCLNSTEDGTKLDLYNNPLNMFEDQQNLECKTDFCPSPNFLDFTKKNYFSDFPSKENMTRMVQARIRQIEEEERKRRNSVDFRDRNRFPSRQSPQNTENSSPFSTQRRNVFPNDNVLNNSNVEKNLPNSDALQCPSPVGRAPTPPPRSPKSMSFVNKAYMQHQNSCLNHDSRSLERKPFYKPNIPVSKSIDTCKADVTATDSKPVSNILDDSAERHKMRELFNARRKTCGYFDYNEDFSFKDLKSDTPTSSNSTAVTSLSSPKSSETKGYLSGNETPPIFSEDPKRRLWRNKWEETEKRHKFLFNSLESKKKVMSPTWSKFSGISQKNDACLCHILSSDKSICTCNHSIKNPSTNSPILSKIESFSHYANLKEIEAHETRNRLSKSEVNIAYTEKPKSKIQNCNSGNMFNDLHSVETKSSKIKPKNDHEDKLSATANLDSAMEELESVYRSLKFSSDTLSEKNSASNVSLNDLNVETSQKKLNGSCITDAHPKSYSVKENNFNSFENKPYNIKPVFNKAHDFLKPSPYSSPIDIPIDTTCKSSESENICIDELFNDLTRQLDIEQKLLKETRDHRAENRTVDLEADKCDKQDQKRMTPLESIVSIRKELYNNLKKDTREPVRPPNYVSKGINYQQQEITKKKYKAVRSLSENISYLMTNANTSPTPLRKISTDKFEPSICNMETLLIEKSSPKHYEHVALEPPKFETKREMSLNQPIVPKRTFVSDRLKKHGEEIRQIRVSMDSNASEAKTVPTIPLSDYPRLSSAVCRQQISPKSEPQVCKQQISPKDESRSLQPSTNVPKESVDVLDENGLEKLLNTLLNDVPDTKQSSLLLSNDHPPSTPPPPVASAGKCDHVKFKRNILPSRMEAYMAAAAQNPVTECTQRLKSEDIAQVKNDFRQNNAHLNQMSFIPVYSSKTVCHKFPKSNENQCENPPERKVLSTYSPPSRPRCIAGNNDVASRIAKTHMRRRSVGFEDMASFTCYGHNFTNDRFQGSVHNSNIPQPHTENHSIFFNPSSTPPLGKINQSESSCFSSLNHNSQLSSGENANDQIHRRTERPLPRYKDKSSKRKSSLNRIDFIQFPSNAGNTHCHSDQSQQQNSSSDEGSESKLQSKKLESPCGTAKRKHSSNQALSKSEVKTNEITLSNSSPAKAKSNMLPRSSLISHLSTRPNRWRHPSAIRFSQKLSHSAGELESLTDLSEVPSRNKIYLSAQEYEDSECSRVSLDSNCSGAITRNSIPKLLPQHRSKNGDSTLLKSNICDSTSQVEIENKSEKDVEPSKLSTSIDLIDYGDISQPADPRDISISNGACSEQITMTSDPSNSVCDDSKDYINAEIDTSAIELENLEITDESKNMDIYLSADENGEITSSDGRRRPSILRKKSFEEKKELHSILKPPPDDKLSKTPPSILKHRESSEEKEIWQSNDLHSILKKSTSEEDSCNSGPDIRPILKLSTDEDSSGGSVRPRPILKKRTSFSDECSYVSFPSGELKPILKKKTPLSSEDQPRPILKCRRKSEDTRSTTSEVITSRPRAYSADMGVKLSHEGQTESSEIKDFCKLDSHDL